MTLRAVGRHHSGERLPWFDLALQPVKLQQVILVRVLLALFVGIVIGAAGLWYYTSTSGRTGREDASSRVHDAIQDKLRVLDLRPQEIKDELARTGQVVRRKVRAAGQAVADATADARITGAIKAKLVANRTLSALSISVNTTNGIVTLSGTVPSTDAISQAMMLAMDTDGVQEVISTLQVQQPHAGSG